MSPTSGSPTITGWKRRSSAASFSMCLRYSSRVVAPTARSSPRASIGFSRLAASTAPSAAPAPTIVCSSSMNRTIWPSAAWISFSTALRRSSNSPRYLEPASRAPMSSAITRRSRRLSGTSPATIRCARPSTIAVLPTPGSPISTGLFLVRRDSTWITRRISSSRPITGSSLPCSASAVRSRPNFSSACIVSSGFGEVTRCGPRTSEIPFSSESRSGSRSREPGGLVGEGEQQVLGGDVLVAEPGHLLLRPLEGPHECLRGAQVGLGIAAQAGQALDRVERALADRGDVGAELLEHRHDQAVLLVEQREQEVRRSDLGVAVLGGEPLGGGDGLLGLDRETVRLHLACPSAALVAPCSGRRDPDPDRRLPGRWRDDLARRRRRRRGRSRLGRIASRARSRPASARSSAAARVAHPAELAPGALELAPRARAPSRPRPG